MTARSNNYWIKDFFRIIVPEHGRYSMTDHREYLDEEYRLAVLDFRCAHNEDEQWNARKRMAQTERTASELYGFDFADSLHKKYLGDA